MTSADLLGTLGWAGIFVVACFFGSLFAGLLLGRKRD